MKGNNKNMNNKNKIYNKNNRKFLLLNHFIILLNVFQINLLVYSKNNFLLFSELNEIKLKIKGIGNFPVLFCYYSFIPSSYYLNDDETPRVFINSTIDLPNPENEVKLIFDNEVGNCTSMFKGCSNIIEIDLSNFISPNTASIDSMFQDCTSLKKINFGNFQTSNMDNMNYVFYRCTSLESLDLSSFVTSKVTHFHYMFGSCTSLRKINLSNFYDNSSVCVNNMFNGCTNINSIDLSNFDFHKVTLIQNMLYNCKNLISLDLSSFGLNSAPTANYVKNVFYSCKELEFVNFKKAVISNTNLKIYEDMVKNSQKNIVFCYGKSNSSGQKNCELKISDCSNWKENNEKMIPNSNVCVGKCTDTSFPYEYSNKCYAKCPYETVENNFICNNCLETGKCGNISPTEFENQIRPLITSYINSKVINGSNFLATILSSDNINPEDQLKNGISAFDFGNCTNVLKEYYKIQKEENLIILNMEIKSEQNKSENNNDKSFNLGKNTELEIYDYSGRKLNLSICKEDIKVFKYIGDVEELDIDTAKDFSNQGIDVYNPSDEFFNDICDKYNNKKGDIIIKDRRNDVY